jgi:hypothetical protein
MALLNRDVEQRGCDHAAQRQIVRGLGFGGLGAFARDLRALVAAGLFDLVDSLVKRRQVRRGDRWAGRGFRIPDVGGELLRLSVKTCDIPAHRGKRLFQRVDPRGLCRIGHRLCELCLEAGNARGKIVDGGSIDLRRRGGNRGPPQHPARRDHQRRRDRDGVRGDQPGRDGTGVRGRRCGRRFAGRFSPGSGRFSPGRSALGRCIGRRAGMLRRRIAGGRPSLADFGRRKIDGGRGASGAARIRGSSIFRPVIDHRGGSLVGASGPILTFASHFGRLLLRMSESKDHQQYRFPVEFWI